MSMVDSLPKGPYIPQAETDSDEDCSRRTGVLKSKENIFKSRHSSKCLKKKLKKYKIRKDGKEDPDVLDVLQSFKQSLKLKSPNQLSTLKAESEDDTFMLGVDQPKNYLFKMARKKQTTLKQSDKNESDKKSKPSKTMPTEENSNEENISVSNDIQKKQTNAFQLLMDSRNKSIGSNTPGKERDVGELASEEIIEKKKTKEKRNLVLQKLAEAKGALKKKELEEHQQQVIQRKMEKRAERLKNLINKGKNKKYKKLLKNVEMYSDSQSKKAEEKTKKNKSMANRKPAKMSNEKFSGSLKNKVAAETPKKNETSRNQGVKNGKLTEVNIFASPDKKKISKDDEEFLKKLSPSIKKKENMMCYFKKLEKEPELVFLSEDEIVCIDEDKETKAINVKLTQKKKNKKKKLSLHKKDNNNVKTECTENNTVNIDVPCENQIAKSKKDESFKNEKASRKRKRIDKIKPIDQFDTPDNTETIGAGEKLNTVEGRPKRNVKKPVKYVDDVQLTSSDEELHIFTPKKKKYVESKTKSEDPIDKELLKRNFKQKIPNSKSTKLAPIFVAKTQVDIAALEAKQKFLHSGMPDQLKKIIAQEKTQAIISNNFYPVLHVQQIDLIESSTSLKLLISSELDSDLDDLIKVSDIQMKKLLSIDQAKENKSIVEPFKREDIHGTLKIIKQSYVEFPVYRTYRTLHSKSQGEQKDFNCIELNNSSEVLDGVSDAKNEDPESLSWIDKYKATSTKHIIGNFESINELKNWLESWTENHDNPKNDNEDSDSDFCNSEGDSRDVRIANNLVIITGPPGCGKTSSVYAIATELAMKVIEVNVSSKRTGKIILQDLQEATQSHKVNRSKGENSQNSQEFNCVKSQHQKKGLKQYTNKKRMVKKLISAADVPLQKSESYSQSSQDDSRTGMSLILIDDADIVFDQDDGFISAIGQLVQSSKRPVILVTTSLSCQHLQRFVNSGNVIKMKPLSPRILGTWLDIMCLADTGVCWPGTGAKLLDYFNGDMRKTINCLQFYVSSEKLKQIERNPSDSSSKQKYNGTDIEDENSSISWADQYSEDYSEMSQNYSSLTQDCAWNYFLGNQINRPHLSYPLDLFNVWWSVPQLLKIDGVAEDKSIRKQRNPSADLERVCDIFDSISLADCISFTSNSDSKGDIFSHPWHTPLSDSVSERENMDDFNSNEEISHSISYELIKSSLENADTVLKSFNNDTYMDYPGLLEKRKKDKLMSRHDVLTVAVNPSSLFDRKALALDYWSSCRTICRIEKEKTDNNLKRNNRFSHYLKSNKSMGKSEVFEKLCDSLRPSESREEL